MLKHLSIDNYALIDHLEVDFDSGLNVITGETGSGKSILLGALSLILGSRADVDSLRDKDRNCVVEGLFDVSRYGLEPMFEQNDLDYEPTVVIRRVISPAGKSRAYVNDLPVSLAVLKSLSDNLIDIHSQHQTILLGQHHFQTGVVDGVCDHASLLSEYRQAYGDLKRAEAELISARNKAEQSAKDSEYIEYQFTKLNDAALYDGEQEELESRQGELSHANAISEVLMGGSEVIGNRESCSIVAELRALEQSLNSICGVYSKADEFLERVRSVAVELKDLCSEMESASSNIYADPVQLEKINERLDVIYSLQKRHSVDSVAELIALRDKFRQELDAFHNMDERIAELEHQVAQADKRARELAAKISDNRRKAAPQIEQYVISTLSQLGMVDAILKVEITSEEIGVDGADAIRFMFSANKGGALQPIEKVASGGEMSRLMLSLKALSARNSDLPTIIFDEIDTGVSGSVADRMGELIVELSSNIQIINITHLPQVASKGSTHFVVSKVVADDKTLSRIRNVSGEERVDELAKMLSGSDVTDAARSQARHLLGLA